MKIGKGKRYFAESGKLNGALFSTDLDKIQ
jgi:hypothetical protein